MDVLIGRRLTEPRDSRDLNIFQAVYVNIEFKKWTVGTITVQDSRLLRPQWHSVIKMGSRKPEKILVETSPIELVVQAVATV